MGQQYDLNSWIFASIGANENFLTSIFPTAFYLMNCFLIFLSSRQSAVMTCPRYRNSWTKLSSSFSSLTLVEYRPSDLLWSDQVCSTIVKFLFTRQDKIYIRNKFKFRNESLYWLSQSYVMINNSTSTINVFSCPCFRNIFLVLRNIYFCDLKYESFTSQVDLWTETILLWLFMFIDDVQWTVMIADKIKS